VQKLTQQSHILHFTHLHQEGLKWAAQVVPLQKLDRRLGAHLMEDPGQDSRFLFVDLLGKTIIRLLQQSLQG